MSNRNITVDADKFGISLEQILERVDRDIATNMPVAVRKACQKAGRTARRNAPIKTGRYKASLSYKVDNVGRGVAVGTVGSRKYPGLVHLLEKGHKTIGGTDVKGKTHMLYGYNDGVVVLIDEMNRVVDRAL